MQNLETLKKEALELIESVRDEKQWEELRVRYLSKKGEVQALMAHMRELSPEEKPKFGALVNALKNEITEALEEKKLSHSQPARSREGVSMNTSSELWRMVSRAASKMCSRSGLLQENAPRHTSALQ